MQNIPNPPEEDMELYGKEFHRYTIAYGLSFPEWERPEIEFPKDRIVYERERENEYSIPATPEYYE